MKQYYYDSRGRIYNLFMPKYKKIKNVVFNIILSEISKKYPDTYIRMTYDLYFKKISITTPNVIITLGDNGIHYRNLKTPSYRSITINVPYHDYTKLIEVA